MSNSKRFDEWTEVDCNECEHWWTSSCDGAKKDTKVPCNSFKATRSVVIPLQIKELDKRLQRLGGAVIILAVINLFLWGMCVL